MSSHFPRHIMKVQFSVYLLAQTQTPGKINIVMLIIMIIVSCFSLCSIFLECGTYEARVKSVSRTLFFHHFSLIMII